ncbi:YciI family protein [Streptomyces sp. NPDC049954]|uniref:YciI family protein n=1 Tax=Streptomyces sp. NPDC049954 TaxID=3155779 RepID=UPI003428BE83
MAVFAVFYTYTDNSAGRDETRPAHRAYLTELAEKGVNLVSGPLAGGPQDGALLLLRAASAEEARAHTEQDPFRLEGLVAEVRVEEWKPVNGPLAGAFDVAN